MKFIYVYKRKQKSRSLNSSVLFHISLSVMSDEEDQHEIDTQESN